MRCSLKKKKKKEESWFLPKTYSVGPQNISRLAFSLPGPEKALNVFFLIIFIEIQQNYNVVLITGLQLSSPIIHTHTNPHTNTHTHAINCFDVDDHDDPFGKRPSSVLSLSEEDFRDLT